jgi:hypothetical protein
MYRKEVIIKMSAVEREYRAAALAVSEFVREYRNTIVHGGDAPPVTLPEARQSLCTFFGWMPPRW